MTVHNTVCDASFEREVWGGGNCLGSSFCGIESDSDIESSHACITCKQSDNAV